MVALPLAAANRKLSQLLKLTKCSITRGQLSLAYEDGLDKCMVHVLDELCKIDFLLYLPVQHGHFCDFCRKDMKGSSNKFTSVSSTLVEF